MKSCDEMVNNLFERRDKYVAEQKRKKAVLVRTITSACCVCVVALLGFGIWYGVMTVDVNSEVDETDTTNDLNDYSEETETAIKGKSGRSGGTRMIINRVPTNYMEMIGKAYDVVLGEVIDSEKAIMTSKDYKSLDENGKANRLQKPYNIKVVKSYKGNAQEGETIKFVTNTLAMNDPETNEMMLKAANEAEDTYSPGKMYLFVLSTDDAVIKRWGKDAYYPMSLEYESVFAPGENGKFFSNSFEVYLNSLPDDIASAEQYISEHSDYDKVKEKIAARKVAE